jgi:hypothetical protein
VNKVYFKIQVAADCPDEHPITFTMHITAADYSCERYVTLTVTKPAFEYVNCFLFDGDGNHDGIADPDETCNLILNVKNSGAVALHNISAVVSSTNPDVTFLQQQQAISLLPAQKITQVVLPVHFGATLAPGSYVPVQYTFTADNCLPLNGDFTMGISTNGSLFDFEGHESRFYSPGDGWSWGSSSTTTAHSGTKMWGSSLNANYSADTNITLYSDPILLSSHTQLKFWHKYNTELNYDGGNVSIAVNHGTTFTLLTPEGGYPCHTLAALQQPSYSGVQSDWTQAVFDLSAYAGQEVVIRWHFCSDSMINASGWFLDDVEFTGTVTPAGMLRGHLLFADETPNWQSASATAGLYFTQPDTTNQFQFFLPPGTQTVNFNMPSYQIPQPQTANITGAGEITELNFNLNYLPAPGTLEFSLAEQQLQMHWSSPLHGSNHFETYHVYRQIDCGEWQLVASVTEPIYTENLLVIGNYKYFVTAQYTEGESSPADSIAFLSSDTVGLNEPIPLFSTRLQANYPNPFNPETTIAFSLSKPTFVTLQIFNLKGQIVRTLVREHRTAGNYQVRWNGRDDHNKSITSGVYFIRMQTPEHSFIRKAMLIK